MKKIIPFLLLLPFVWTRPMSAQWLWLNPDPEGNELFGASFVTATRGWVVGGNGAVLHTTDRGATWTSQVNPLRTTPFICLGVAFVDSNTGLISSNNGMFIRTSDGGTVWSLIPSPGLSIQKLRKAPDGSIWGFGSLGALARTTDAGLNWRPVATNITDVVFDVAFPSASSIVAVCGGGIILSSSDSGNTWTKHTLPVASDVVSVDFVSPTSGFAVQKSKFLLRTTDGGVTWNDTTIFVNTLRTVRFADAKTGWLISNGAGSVLKTTNGGVSWFGLAVDTTNRYAFQNVVSFGPQDAMFLGEGGAIFHSTNGGATRVQLGSGVTRAHLHSVTALGDAEAWYFGERTALHTTNAGLSWSANRGSAIPIHCGYAISSSRVVAGGTQGEVYLSTDAGQTWSEQRIPTQGQIERIVFVDPQNGWLAGNHGTIARTTDGGTTWTYTNPGVTDDFHAVSAVSAQKAWVAGNGGKILSTTDGGQTWTPQTTNTSSNLHAIQFVSPTVGYAGGQLVLLFTVDGGQSWSPRTLPGLDVVYDLSFRSPTEGIVLLSRGAARTTDGGQSFYRTDYPSTNLRALSTTGTGVGWLAGDFGVMQRYLPAPAILLNPSTLDFGSVPINKQKSMDIVIQNTGERPMFISNATVLGIGFTLVKIDTNRLDPGQSTRATIHFAPPDTQVFRGLATIVSNAAIGLSTVDLIGRGIPPLPSALIHSPDTVNFGKRKLGTITIREVLLQNRSSLNLLIDDEHISGGDSLQFQIGRMSMLFILASAFDSIQVVFGPQKPGVFSSTLFIDSNDPAEPVYSIPLRGEAINPQATCIPSTLQFGPVVRDSTGTMTIVIRNTGTDTLRVYKGYTQGGDAAEFSIGSVSQNPIPPGDSIVVIVRFNPKDYGPKSATLVFETNDIMNPGSYVQLIGRGTTLDAPGLPGVPADVMLSQNYPNPVSASTHRDAMFLVGLPVAGDVRLTIHDMLGRERLIIAERRLPAGVYSIPFNASALTPGTYPVHLTVDAAGHATVRRSVVTVVLR